MIFGMWMGLVPKVRMLNFGRGTRWSPGTAGVKTVKQYFMITKLGLKNCWCKLKMMVTFIEVKGHQRSNVTNFVLWVPYLVKRTHTTTTGSLYAATVQWKPDCQNLLQTSPFSFLQVLKRWSDLWYSCSCFSLLCNVPGNEMLWVTHKRYGMCCPAGWSSQEIPKRGSCFRCWSNFLPDPLCRNKNTRNFLTFHFTIY